MKIGDTVWVTAHKYDLSQDELGTIVALDCPYVDADDDNLEKRDTGGVRVKLTVSNSRLTVSPSRIRITVTGNVETPTKSTTTTTTTEDQSRSRRYPRAAKSSSSSLRGVTPSPATMSSSTMTAKRSSSSTSTSSSSSSSGRKNSRFFSTTATSKSSSTASSGTSHDSDSDDEDDDNSKDDDFDVDTKMEEDSDDEPLSNLKRKGPPVAHSKPKKKSTATSASSAKQTTTKKTMTKKTKQAAASTKTAKKPTTSTAKKNKKKEVDIDDPSDRPLIMASDTDSDDEKDRPYRVEYATTGRSTCRSCDQKILKGEVRIASRPLFRGKPGFVVYRHLKCQLLPPEEVPTMTSVGGWKRLKESDRKLLQKQVEESVRLVEQENEELDADELVQTAFEGEIRSSPPGLAATLLPFQVEGVSWMYAQEMGEIKGGILSDEMGMGKTLQTITTILDNRPLLQHTKPGSKHPPSSPDIERRKAEDILWKKGAEECRHALEMAGVPQSILNPPTSNAKKKKKKKTKNGSSSTNAKKVEIGARAGTLVICPVIALTQWRTEIEKFTEENALSVVIYHGNDRQSRFPRELLSKYDVILTTYQVIEADYRKMVSPNKVKCPNCGRSFKIEKLAVHLKYFCGETAQRTEAQMRQRRTADRHQQAPANRGRNGGGASGGRSGSSAGKKSMSAKKTFKKTPPKAKPALSKAGTSKKHVRAKSSKDYDSDSSLSVPDDIDTSSSRRPSRMAAASATKKMHASAKAWASNLADDDSEEESEAFAEESSSEDDDDDDSVVAPARRGQTKGKKSQPSSSSDSDSDSEEDEAAMARVRKRQKLALEMASKSKKMPPKKGQKGSKAKASAAMAKGRKKKMPDDYSSDDDSDDDDSDRDPLDGIDMEALQAEAMEGCEASVLHTMCFYRIVLDEAHNIKNRASQTAAAAFHLTSIHRWCLSGTPLQNRVGDFYSLIRFLQIDPWAHYLCRREDCDCKSLFYRMKNGICQDCGHASSQHYSHFNRTVLNVIQREGYSGDGRRAMLRLKEEVLDKALLRRTKDSRAEDMNLPPRVVTIKSIRLHPREQDFYDGLYTQTKTSFDDYVEQDVLLNNYGHIFDLLTKLRQSVDHPYLLVYSKKNAGQARLGQAPVNVSSVCELCEETPTDRVIASCCDAAFCRGCVVDMMNSLEGESTSCPSCRNPFTIDLNQEAGPNVEDDEDLKVSQKASAVGMPSLKDMTHVASGSILRRIPLTEFATSTKIEALIQELVQMRQERKGNKALVFSQFVNMLDLVRWRLHSDPCLHDLGLGVRIIHGGMNVKSRDEALKAFREDPSVRVLLMSLKAGGVALNLTVANEAYLLDPWWNPAAEMQAIDRTHRLGQYRPIRAVRFICEGTVEERVLQLQEKKRLVFDGTVGRDAASLKMLTVEDMKSLFT